MTRQEISDLYDALIATHPKVERKGKNNPYTSVNGHMFSFIGKDDSVGIRLSKKDKEAFEKKYKSGPMIQYGSVMRGYVVIPEELLRDTKTLAKYLKKSYDHFSSIKPKPTKK